MNLHDAGMLQPGDGLCFAVEARDNFNVGMCPRQNHLQGDDPVKANLACLVDNAHSAASNLLQTLVIAKVA